MSAVKVFFHSSHHALSDGVQEWLRTAEVTVLDISMDSNQYGHCLTILYEPGGGRRHEAQIFFSKRHDSLEYEANQSLTLARPGGRQLVAVGSNEYGHCLCVIREV